MRSLTENAMTTRDVSQVLSARATKVLQELGVHKVGQLQDLNPSRIKPILGAGPKPIRDFFHRRLDSLANDQIVKDMDQAGRY